MIRGENLSRVLKIWSPPYICASSLKAQSSFNALVFPLHFSAQCHKIHNYNNNCYSWYSGNWRILIGFQWDSSSSKKEGQKPSLRVGMDETEQRQGLSRFLILILTCPICNWTQFSSLKNTHTISCQLSAGR